MYYDRRVHNCIFGRVTVLTAKNADPLFINLRHWRTKLQTVFFAAFFIVFFLFFFLQITLAVRETDVYRHGGVK